MKKNKNIDQLNDLLLYIKSMTIDEYNELYEESLNDIKEFINDSENNLPNCRNVEIKE